MDYQFMDVFENLALLVIVVAESIILTRVIRTIIMSKLFQPSLKYLFP